jgi:hypothetical protein
VTEGKTTHVSIEKVKTQYKYTKNDKVCGPVNAQNRKHNKKTCCYDKDF